MGVFYGVRSPPKAFVGVGDGDLPPPPLALSLGNTPLRPKAKILFALLKRKAF